MRISAVSLAPSEDGDGLEGEGVESMELFTGSAGVLEGDKLRGHVVVGVCAWPILVSSSTGYR